MIRPKEIERQHWIAAKIAIFSNPVSDKLVKAIGRVDLVSAVSQAMQKAALNEREACAKIADGFSNEDRGGIVAEEIAFKIRQQGTIK